MRKLSTDNTTSFYCLFFFLSLFIVHHASAQTTQRQVYEDSVLSRYADATNKGYSKANSYYIGIATNKLPSSARIIRQLDDKIAIIEIDSEAAYNSLNTQVRIAPAGNSWKWSPSLEKASAKQTGTEQYIVTGQNIDDLLFALKAQKDIVVVNINRPSHSVIIRASSQYLRQHLLDLKEVIFIDKVAEANPEINIIGYNRSFHGINAVDYLIPNANGKGIVAGVKEQKMDESDLDLWKRVLSSSIAPTNTTYHATVIASIIGGAGNSFYDGRGIAWGCSFFPSSFSNLFADDASVLNTNKVTVQNHSYGTIIQQFYGAEAVTYDVLTWNNKNYIPVISSGNQGEAPATEGKYASLAGYANLTGNFKMAKNVITVGAIDNKDNIPAQSSAGPLYDGRLAPQLIALGPNGTSDAAAVVTGTIAVMQQVYADSNSGNTPPASLIKAVLYNTANDVYRTGIDYKTGYGLLNSYDAVKAIQQKTWAEGSVSDAQQWTKIITVPVSAAELKLTLSWTDSAATVNNNKALINDLDLELVSLSRGTIYKPWVLSAVALVDSLTATPTRKRDSLNTAEQVTISLPAAGNYEVRVKGYAISAGPIPFHIAWTIDTLNTFLFTSPQHASDVDRQKNENLTIRWKTFVTDTTATGILLISYDEGASWQLLQSSIRLTANKFQWTVKDTASAAVLKMETGFGSFLSNRFIISPVTRLRVDFVCADSFRLSWTRHIYANSYRIFTLTDNPYLQPVVTVADTFAVLQRTAYPSRVYAVEPVLSNGIRAARSMAMNIDMQGVQCFYRTLNYNLLDQNGLLLILELSVATYADSVYFEKVSATGGLLQTYGGVKANNADLLYRFMVNELSPGTTYLRGRIKLKSGAVVYTDIIPVLTTGKKYILFYPNPVDRNKPLTYALQQGVSTSSRLQFFDAYGRLLRSYSSMPNKIEIREFPTGMIFYKLITEEGRILETGKLLVGK